MAYTPTVWANGDTITAAKLNNIESGIQAVSGKCVYDDTNFVLDKSYNDLLGMLDNGAMPYFVDSSYLYTLGLIDPEGDGIMFRRNAGALEDLFFILPGGDPDAPLTLD